MIKIPGWVVCVCPKCRIRIAAPEGSKDTKRCGACEFTFEKPFTDLPPAKPKRKKRKR